MFSPAARTRIEPSTRTRWRSPLRSPASQSPRSPADAKGRIAVDPVDLWPGSAKFIDLAGARTPGALKRLLNRPQSSAPASSWPPQHLIDEHICRFNVDADNPSQKPYHSVSPALRLLF